MRPYPLNKQSVIVPHSRIANQFLQQASHFVPLHRAMRARRRVLLLHALDQRLLQKPPPQAPIEELPRRFPLQHVSNHALGHHPARSIVQVRKLVRNLQIHGQQRVLPLHDLRFHGSELRRRAVIIRRAIRRLRQTLIQRNQLRIQPMHRFDLVRLAELHLADPRRFKNAASRFLVGVHLHHALVNGRIDHHPRAASELAVRRQVNKHGLLVLPQRVHNLRAEFQHFSKHITRASAKPTPISKDHQRQLLPAPKVFNRLCRLIRAIREPHLSRLRLHNLSRVRVRRVRRNHTISRSRFNCNHSHRNPAKPCSSNHHALAPIREVLLERTHVKEPALAFGRPGQHVPHVVRSPLRRREFHVAFDRVAWRGDWRVDFDRARHVRQPPHDRVHAFLVILNQLMRHTVRKHDLRTSQLVERRVHVAPKQLVQRLEPCEDDRPVALLNHALSQPHQIRADSDRAARRKAQRKHLVVRKTRLARNQPRPAQVLHTNPVNLPNDIRKTIPNLAARLDLDALRGDRAPRQVVVVVFGEVQVLKTERWVVFILERYFEQRLERFHQSNPRARVARHVDARDAVRARVLARTVKELVLLHSKRARLERHVVRDQHNIAPFRILRRLHAQHPPDHSNIVEPRGPLHELHAGVVFVHHELRRREQASDSRHSRAVAALTPRVDQAHLKQRRQIIRVRRPDSSRRHSLHLLRPAL
mmetsp:Transcript_9554/g.20149  ORF Transcript_9554/g.20149 Transcript_9554/m.20149 type:complete len:702 (-) Transcript_9554:71-2176(-)